MRLISLTANNKSFRPIFFNESGVSLIVGRQKEPVKRDSGKTYNGVGKSLAVALVHFCLGSNKNEALEAAIPGWEFTLSFKLDGKNHVSVRSTSAQEKIFLDGKKMGVKKFGETLNSKVFDIPEPIPFLKFRPLIKRFIRPGKDSYIVFDSTSFHEEKQSYQKMICNSFLLGLETGLVTEKHRLATERREIEKFKRNLEKDSVFIEFFTNNKDVEIELKDIEENIARLEKELAAFKVAKNYHEIQKSADKTKRNLDLLKNKAVVLENAIENIRVSLKIRPDIPSEKLIGVYEKTRAAFPDTVVKNVREVSAFHDRLIANRIKRLTSEKARLKKDLESINSEIATLGRQMDEQLKYLSTHGALDEFVSLSNLLSDYKTKAGKIRDYRTLLEKYSDEIQDKNDRLNLESKKTKAWLKDAKDLIDKNLETFRGFSRRFYPDKPGGLTVKNNDGDNQLRFDIRARIQDDKSDGINEAKIFCYDLTVLTSRYNHRVEFLFHDSRLFSDMDPRQRATLFKIAHEYTSEGQGQYIASLNEDQILSMKNQFTDEEFKKIISDNIILELTDDSPESKLLGIQVDRVQSQKAVKSKHTNSSLDLG